MDRAGTIVGTVGAVDRHGGLAVSGDGKRVVVAREDPETRSVDLWLYEDSRATPSRLTLGPTPIRNVALSPGGDHIVFSSVRGESFALYQKLTNGTRPEEVLVTSGRSMMPNSWSSDDRFIIYQTNGPDTGQDIWALPLSGDRKPFPVAQSEHGEREGQLSPDSRWIAYDSTESGRRDVWMQPFPPTGSRWQISTGGGFSPRWRGDGRELYYVAADGKLMAVAVGAGPTPEAGVPTTLFQTMFREGAYGSYEVAQDGQRFLMKVPPAPGELTPITVVVNWTASLKR